MGGFVGDVISFIGRPFGIYTHNETFTDLQVSNLLTPDVADKAGRKNARHRSMGSAETYFKGYRAFQRDYRKKYSKKFMENLGYLPSSTASTRTITGAKAEVYIETLYSYTDVDIEVAKDAYLTNVEKYNHAVRSISGYEYVTGHIIDTGKTYIVIGYDVPLENTVEVNTEWYYEENIIDNLTTNYTYDGTYVTIAGEVYTVGTISNAINGSNQYETECTRDDGGTPVTEIIYTDVENSLYTVVNNIYASEASYIGYRVTSGEVGTELRYYVAVANTIDVYDRVNVDVTTIITMKEDNVMVDTENRQLNRMLKRLNLSGDQLEDSINNPDMDSAYLMTGINPAYDDDITNKTMHTMFDLMSTGSGNVSISMDRLNMRYNFNIQKNTMNGTIGPVGTITRINTPKGTPTPTMYIEHLQDKLNQTLSSQYDPPKIVTLLNRIGVPNPLSTSDYDKNASEIYYLLETLLSTEDLIILQLYLIPLDDPIRDAIHASMVLSLQVDSNEYRVLTITDFQLTYTVSGEGFTAYLDSTGGYCRLVVPLDILNSLKYKEFVWIYERGLCMLAFATETVEVQWYETGAFGTLLKIAAVVIAVVTLGSGTQISTALMNLAVVMAITYAAQQLAIMIGGDLGVAIGVVAAVVAMIYFTPMTLNSMDMWLMTFQQYLGIEQQRLNHEMQNVANDAEKYRDMMKEKNEELEQLQKEMDENSGIGYIDMFDSSYAGRSNSIFRTTEEYCNSIVDSTDLSLLVEYDRQIAYNINIRNSVTVV